MDRRDLESGARLHQDQPGLQALLRRDFRRAVPRRAGHPYEQGFDLRLVPEKLAEPLRWSEPTNDLRQLDERPVPRRRAGRLHRAVAASCSWRDWHTYQVLTKRSERLREHAARTVCGMPRGEPHIWWGVSVEDRKYGLPRIDDLQAAPAAVRFLSVEPLLEDLGKLRSGRHPWVIVGGESGPGAQPMQEEWVLSIREQCEAAGVPFFFKQWGGVRKKEAGRTLLRGRTHDAIPKRVENPTLPSTPQCQQHALEIESGELVQLGTA